MTTIVVNVIVVLLLLLLLLAFVFVFGSFQWYPNIDALFHGKSHQRG